MIFIAEKQQEAILSFFRFIKCNILKLTMEPQIFEFV